MKSKSKYLKVASYEAKKGEFDTCLLLYSGGLDTSVMIKWIKEEYQCHVITLTVDLGQSIDDINAIKQKALKLGAKKAIVVDAKDDFAHKLLSKAIKANADYQGGYALSTPLGRIMISEIAVDIANELGCSVIAHGATGKGNDQVRFESYITTLDSNLKIIAPVREWSMGRDEEIQYAIDHDIPVKQTVESPYSYDENLWGNTCEGGEIEDPTQTINLKNVLLWTAQIEDTPEKPCYITIGFHEGVPVSLNGKKYKLSAIIDELNAVGSSHGVGVAQLIEDRLIGMKVRGVYENPAATILIAAHKKLEMIVSTRQENEFKLLVDNKWAYLTYAAQWYDPIVGNLNSYIENQNKKVNGLVTVKLHKGSITIVSIESKFTLFDKEAATFNKENKFNQNAAAGFTEFHALAQKTAHSKAMTYNRGSDG